MSLLLIRHGSTDLNQGGKGSERTRGWLNVPLAPQGHQEAQQAAEMSKDYPLKAIITSDLDRARTTAQYVSQQHPGVPVHATPILRPWNVGDLTGQLYKDATPILDDHLQHPDQKIPGGESFYQFAQRSLPLLQHLAESPDLYGVVTHNWNIKLLRAMESSKGAELDHSVVAQDNPVKPGHLLHVDPSYALDHIKPSDGPVKPGGAEIISGGPPVP